MDEENNPLSGLCGSLGDEAYIIIHTRRMEYIVHTVDWTFRLHPHVIYYYTLSETIHYVQSNKAASIVML